MKIARRYYVNFENLPDPKREYVQSFENLNGGLNLYDLDYLLKSNESPEMKNLNWHNGVLSCRDGQTFVGNLPGWVYSCAEEPFHGKLICHCGVRLLTVDPETGRWLPLLDGIPAVRGTFFRYDEFLMYKTRGGYYRISYRESDHAVVAESIYSSAEQSNAFCPTIQINTDPETGKGDQYQPENRLSGYKKVQFNAASGVREYHLPVQEIGEVRWVRENGAVVASEDYTVNAKTGVITFHTAPPVSDPPVNNTVEVLYYKENPKAYNSVMDCPYATVFGGNRDLCVVVGGCTAQPNAYFWSGNTQLAMDPTYFPMSQYNFAADASEGITGFGKQQNMLVIFKEHSVGRATYGTAKVNGREQITMDYTRINSRIGCDLPWTIQLVENNLVFCNRREGVHLVKDSSAAYENNIVCISRKVNGDTRRSGLTGLLRKADESLVCSMDNDRKYVVTYMGEAYEWDYTLSEYQNPTWFYHDNIRAVCFAQDQGKLWEFGTNALYIFERTFLDFGEAIEKIYRFPTQHFGSYDRLKTVKSVVFSTRADAQTRTHITWGCDYGTREDKTPIEAGAYQLSPRDLSRRDLSGRPYALVARRKPGYHNIHHFSMKLYNNDAGKDLSVVSAQIFYTFRGRER